MSQIFVLRALDTVRVNIAANCKRYIDILPTDKSFQIEITPLKKRRSLSQNAYLWSVPYKILEDTTGHEAAYWHDYFLGSRFGWETIELFGETERVPARRSSKLTTAEFSDYVEFIQRKCAEHNLYIPSPNEYMEAA
jgi:hypothetical protein